MHPFDPVRGDKPKSTRSAATAADLVKRCIFEYHGSSSQGNIALARAGRAARRFIFAAQNIFDIFLQCKFNNK